MPEAEGLLYRNAGNGSAGRAFRKKGAEETAGSRAGAHSERVHFGVGRPF